MTYNQLTNEGFIEKAKHVHGDKYDYSKVKYTNNHTKVCIICPEHGEFWQRPYCHLNGQKCEKCSRVFKSNAKKSNTKDFIEKAKKVHGDEYDYSKVEYINNSTKVCIICPEHGEFWQTPNNHLKGAGCLKCYNEKRKKTGNNQRLTTEQFIEKAKKIHGNKYDYHKADYFNVNTKICIICPKHGEFWQRPDHHLNGVGCPICNESHLEREIRILLKNNEIDFIQNASKKALPWIEKQHLDFYLPKFNAAIECQGIQHFEPRKRFGGMLAYEKCKELDKRKMDKCEKNGVKLFYYGDFNANNKFSNYFTNAEKLLKEIKGTV